MSPNHNALIRTATIASVSLATVLILVKFIAWRLTCSLSMQASLVDSMLDGAASLINFFAVKHALSPADAEHRFGHGKAEALAGLGQTVFIAASGCWLLFDALQRLIFKPSPISFDSLSMGLMIFALTSTCCLTAFQYYVVRTTNSLAVFADSLHYRTDILANLAVIISLKISTVYDLPSLDIFFGVAIALYILKSSWNIGYTATNILMDRELTEEVRQKILELALGRPQVIGVHDLRTRSAGSKNFVQMHLELSAQLDFTKAHQIAQEVSGDIAAHFPNSEVIINIAPINSPRPT